GSGSGEADARRTQALRRASFGNRNTPAGEAWPHLARAGPELDEPADRGMAPALRPLRGTAIPCRTARPCSMVMMPDRAGSDAYGCRAAPYSPPMPALERQCRIFH